MSQWTDRVRGSSVWQSLEASTTALDQAATVKAAAPEVLEAISRLKNGLIFLKQRLSSADPDLVQSGPFENMASHMQGVLSEIQNFVANGNAGHLQNANSNLDALLAYCAQINVPLTTKDLVGLHEAADSYRSAVSRNLQAVHEGAEQIREELALARTQLAGLSQEVAAERQRSSAQASEFQSQFSLSQEKRVQEYADAQTTRQEKFATMVTEQDKRVVEFVAAFDKQQTAFQTDQQLALSELDKTYRANAAKILVTIEKQKSDVEKLVGVIGNLGVTSGYLKAANEAKYTARFWQSVTVLALGSLIWVAAKAFLPAMEGTFSWPSFAGRVFLSLTVGVLAAYAASQADKQQDAERRNRKLALELEAIGPYLSPLSQEKQDEFRIKVGDRSFSGDGAITSHDKSPASVVDVLMKSKELRQFVVDIVKAAKSE